MNVPSLLEAVGLLAQGGAVGVVVSFLFEQVAWFQRLEAKVKRWSIFGLMIGVPVLAQFALQRVPPEVWAACEPYWRAIALGFVAWAGSQMAHEWQKKQ